MFVEGVNKGTRRIGESTRHTDYGIYIEQYWHGHKGLIQVWVDYVAIGTNIALPWILKLIRVRDS